MEWIRKHPAIAGAVGIALLILLGYLFDALRSGEPTVEAADGTTTSSTAAAVYTTEAAVAGEHNPDVGPLDCNPLIKLEEVDEALGVAGELRGFFQFSGGEACTHVMDGDEDFFVRIEPGSPADFEPGAEIEGRSGEPVAGVGDGAVWFGDDSGGLSTIAVRQETSLGTLIFRVTVSRPDADGATHREVTKTVALAALYRFPGVEPPPAVEPKQVTLEAEPVDLSDESYARNLLAREADGEWTRGEGLVATLRLFAGEVDSSEVLRHPDLFDYSGTGVILLAREYLESGPDEAAKDEIARLLGLLVPSPDRLEEMADPEGAQEVSGLLVSLADVFTQQEPGSENFCADSYGAEPPCLNEWRSTELEGKWPGQFRVFAPKSDASSIWPQPRIEATVEALRTSIVAYQKLVTMPSIDVVLTGFDETELTTNTDYDGGYCSVWVHPTMKIFGLDSYKQFLARDIAYCLIDDAMPDPTSWYRDGLATYLSGYVYPKVNLEQNNLPDRLEANELSTNLVERDFTNWIFFERLHRAWGPEGILSFLSALPGTIGAIEDEWHPFVQDLTDNNIPDIGGGDVPYPRPPHEEVDLSGPIEMTPTPRPCCGEGGSAGFVALARAQMTVPSGKKACVSYEPEGPIKMTWRSGVVGTTGGAWSDDLPDELTDVAVFVATATGDGAKITMKVEKVVDSEDDCEEEDQQVEPGDCPDFCAPSSYYWDEID